MSIFLFSACMIDTAVLTVEDAHFLADDFKLGLCLGRILKFRRSNIQNLPLEVFAIYSWFERWLINTLNFLFCNFFRCLYFLYQIRVVTDQSFNIFLMALHEMGAHLILIARRDFDLGGALDHPHDRMKLTVLNSSNRTHYLYLVICSFVLLDRVVWWVMMLLVAQHDVFQKWAFTWEEGAGHLETFSVPKLAFDFSFFFDLRL